jgi:low molecular weight protein-tyrosine phosphatase
VVYLGRQVARALGLIRDRSRRLPAKMRCIVFVCHGNIIRSPMAAALLARMLSEGDYPAIAICSAGLYATPEKPADERARIAAVDFGVSLGSHRAQPFTELLGERADAICVMDFENEALLLSRCPQFRRKVLLLGSLTLDESNSSVEILDPYEGTLDDIRACYQRLERHIRELARRLSGQR